MAAHLLLAVVDGLPSSVGLYSEGPPNLTTMGRMVFVELCDPHESLTYSNADARRELLTMLEQHGPSFTTAWQWGPAVESALQTLIANPERSSVEVSRTAFVAGLPSSTQLGVAEALAEQRAVQSCWLVLADRMQAEGVTLVAEQHHPDDLRELEVLRASLKMALRGKAAREAELEAAEQLVRAGITTPQEGRQTLLQAAALDAETLCDLCSAPTDNDPAPDPYAWDIDGDDTPVVLCDRCYDERVQEI